MTNGIALNHDKNLKIYFFCEKRQAKHDFMKDIESRVELLWSFVMFFSTKRVDHSNTRLSHQLERNPGKLLHTVFSYVGCN